MATEGQIRWTTEEAAKAYNDLFRPFAGDPTLDTVIEHYLFCAEIATEHQIRSEARNWWGMTQEQIVAAADAIVKARRKNAGKRALIAKLGREGASEYVSRKAGRIIHLS